MDIFILSGKLSCIWRFLFTLFLFSRGLSIFVTDFPLTSDPDGRAFRSGHPAGKALPKLRFLRWHDLLVVREIRSPGAGSFLAQRDLAHLGFRDWARSGKAKARGRFLHVCRRVESSKEGRRFSDSEKRPVGHARRVPQDFPGQASPSCAFASLLHRCLDFSSKFHFHGKITPWAAVDPISLAVSNIIIGRIYV